MKNIVEWMNNNNGFIMGILTLVYVLATILICVFNYKSAKATKEQTAEAKKQFRQTNRPNIIPHFTLIEGQLFCLSFKNIGNECAKGVKIAINQEWIECFNMALKQKKIPGNILAALDNDFFIVPNDELKFALMVPGDGTTMYKELIKEKIKLNIQYSKNDLSETFEENFVLDLMAMSGMILDKSDYNRKMEKQEKALREIAKSISRRPTQN